jgi:D-beta-D-heptose 7-phosphate kinase/D-beta-D-heptose 1-phosphate adenosyltransferase
MKILVIGDVCDDVFIYGVCERLCPEAPVPVFKPTKVTRNLGMAGNVYDNLLSLDVEVVDLLSNKEKITKTRYVDEKSNQMLIRVDDNDVIENTFKFESINFEKYDAVIVSDYDKGFLTTKDLELISNSHDLTFLDTKKILGPWAVKYSYIKINETEWQNCEKGGLDYNYWKEKLIITKSSKGCLFNDKTYPTENELVIMDVSGAGDTFMAAFVVSYVKNKDMDVSIRFANHCSGIVIQKRGVSAL